jgi:hypothetical protein
MSWSQAGLIACIIWIVFSALYIIGMSRWEKRKREHDWYRPRPDHRNWSDEYMKHYRHL